MARKTFSCKTLDYTRNWRQKDDSCSEVPAASVKAYFSIKLAVYDLKNAINVNFSLLSIRSHIPRTHQMDNKSDFNRKSVELERSI
jgi:hypothetical protein